MMIVAKGRLLVVVLVLIALCDAAVLTPVQEQMFMGLMNFIRMIMAKKGFIANMHALSWDKSVAKEIEAQATELKSMNCDFPAFMKKHEGEEKEEVPGRVALFFKEDATMEKLGKMVEEQLDNGEWPDELLKGLGWELFMHPLQTTVGCAKVDCPILIPNTDVTLHLEMLCVMGPHKTFKVSDYELGDAGSECDASEKEESGLCVPSGKKAQIDQTLKEDKAMAKFGAKDDIGVRVAKLKKKSGDSKSDETSTASTPNVFALIVLAAYLAF